MLTQLGQLGQRSFHLSCSAGVVRADCLLPGTEEEEGSLTSSLSSSDAIGSSPFPDSTSSSTPVCLLGLPTALFDHAGQRRPIGTFPCRELPFPQRLSTSTHYIDKQIKMCSAGASSPSAEGSAKTFNGEKYQQHGGDTCCPPSGNYLPERGCEGPRHHSLTWWSLCAVPIVTSRSPVILSQMDPSQENNASGSAGKHQPTSWWNASRPKE